MLRIRKALYHDIANVTVRCGTDFKGARAPIQRYLIPLSQ